ncbi:hypothetical protein LCGC14_1641960 [marine sediment metagenome]|uniref:Uncharacterized protein n=1 Tax=marine sediment metagenome TaxID=412755 RepID=A0A0F9I022_9ZZZZ
MRLSKIIKVEEPKEQSYYALYHITFENEEGTQYFGALNIDDYKLLMKYHELIDKGVKQEDLGVFEDLVRAVAERDYLENYGGI